MRIYLGDDLTKDAIAGIAQEAGTATHLAIAAASVPPDLNSTRVFELIFQAMLAATDAAPLCGTAEKSTEETVS